jgi:integrase
VEDASLFFLTRCGRGWCRPAAAHTKDGGRREHDVVHNPVTKEFRKLMDRVGIGGHRNYYCLRHTFRTIGDEVKDQPAVDFIMGHESGHMSSVYRETISDDRLRAVADHVRTWLFGDGKGVADE